MHDGASLLAVIPARGGSKGLPNKNILDCAGKPMIAWTIEAARAATAIDAVLVSTESEQIAEVSRRAGADVPFLRPDMLATDDASVLDAIAHAWEHARSSRGTHFDYVVILQPTSPLRHAGYISDAIRHYFARRTSERDTLASVFEVGTKYGWLMQLEPETPHVRFCFDVASNAQRQRLRPYFMPNGAIFIAKASTLGSGLYRDCTLPFVMPAADSIDVDSLEDFRHAERVLRAR